VAGEQSIAPPGKLAIPARLAGLARGESRAEPCLLPLEINATSKNAADFGSKQPTVAADCNGDL
jgi:hypothetical protein